MLQNYMRVAWRNLVRNPVYSLINLAGLSVGLCVCFFALHYVRFELSYDRHHAQAKDVVRLVTDVQTSNGIEKKSTTGAMGPAVAAAFPDVQAAARLFPDYLIIKKDENLFAEEKIAYADASLFTVLTVPLVEGNPAEVFNASHQIVLSEAAATKYFGKESPVGKQLFLNGKDPATITGVMKNMPRNAHFRTDFLVSLKTLGPDWEHNWKRFFFYTYLLLNPGTDREKLTAGINELVKSHTDQSKSKFLMAMEPLTDVYLRGDPRGTRSGTSEAGSLQNVYVFAGIALIVLLIACFNFINLTSAFALRRIREMSVRKVLGSQRRQLIGQFLTDAVLMGVLAGMFATFLSLGSTNWFNALAGKEILGRSMSVVLLLPAGLLVGLFAGLYPALYLTGFATLEGLKSKMIAGVRGVVVRKGLVVVQFAGSLLLIVATIVVYCQLHFMKERDSGFSQERRLLVDYQFDGRIPKASELLKQRFADIGLTLSSCVPGKPDHTYPTRVMNSRQELQEFQADAYFIDHDFLKQFGIGMAAGRGFLKERSSDSTEALVINEAMSKALGFAKPDLAIGKPFEQLNRKGVVIGVVKDFHFESVQNRVKPLTMRIAPGFYTFLTMPVSASGADDILRRLQLSWKEIAPELPLVYHYSESAFDGQYLREERFGQLFTTFSLIAMLLSCLGLVGLSILTIRQRTREIGIRKVLGASVAEVFALLSKDFLKLIIIGMLIAAPVGWWVMHTWLNAFPYRITLHFWMFLAAGVIVLFSATMTVGIQTFRAALSNPTKSLASE